MITEPPPSRAGSLPLVGGVLALDFCNTSSGRGTAGHLEHLQSCAHLLAWAQHADVIDAAKHAILSRRWDDAPPEAQVFLSRAIRLRDAIYRLVAALAAHEEPEQASLDVIGREQAACLSKGHLGAHDGGFGWRWAVDEAPEELILGPIASSAMALITSADGARLKQCSGYHCGWLFLDTTKSNNRRWCEMEVCGNRAKQRRRRAQPRPAA